MRKLRSHKEQLIKRLKDPKYASAYLKACLDESFETNDIGIFQLAIRYVVEANGGMAKISSEIEVVGKAFTEACLRKEKQNLLLSSML